MERQSTVKLLICYHKPDKLLEDEILTPIHVGRARARAVHDPNVAWMEAHMIGDDTGENISLRNDAYNELTATYWAWKNYDRLGNPEYLGLMHYRRHFLFDRTQNLSFVEFEGMGEDYLDRISYSAENVRALVAGNDVVYYRGKVSNIYEHYRENHKIEDLELALEILRELQPEDADLAAQYVKGDTGCFCNMAIFSRDAFFAYCEWLFPILEEFCRRVDMSEKRLFISERLTGIFVAKMIAEGKRALPLASSFVRMEYRIPVALPLDGNRVFEIAVTLQSFIEHAKPTTHLDFYLLTDGISAQTRAFLTELVAKRPDFQLTVVELRAFCREKGIEDVVGREALYPFLVGELLADVGKCFYVTSDVLIMRDIEEFFRLCSVDDFWIVGDGTRAGRGVGEWRGSSCVINTKRMREHRILESFQKRFDGGASVIQLLEMLCQDQFSVYPAWFWVDADEKTGTVSKKSEREKLQNDAVWHPMICYTDKTHPMQAEHAPYSAFWWRIARTMPDGLIEAEPAEKAAHIRSVIRALPKESGLLFKMKRYYRQFGLRRTLQRIFQKRFGGKPTEP